MKTNIEKMKETFVNVFGRGCLIGKEKRMENSIKRMKETLTLIADVAESLEADLKRNHAPSNQIQDVANIRNIARDAAAFRLRNCDVGTPEEQIARHQNYCGNGSGNIRCINSHDHSECKRCFAKWMQLPYNGGCIE